MLTERLFPIAGSNVMARNRQKKNKRREQLLCIKNGYGFKDPTPYEAVKSIRNEKRSE